MDQPGTAVRSDWRPTRLIYGEVVWYNNHGRLELRVGDENSFVPNYLSSTKPLGRRRKKPLPSNQRELVLATAWRLVFRRPLRTDLLSRAPLSGALCAGDRQP